MGHTSLSSQALSAPPYLVAFLVVILSAWLSDRLQSRSLFIIIHALVGAAGYAMMTMAGYLNWSNTIRYLAVYPAAAGFFSAVTLIITWTINNQPSDCRKGTGLSLLNLVGQCAPLLGTRLFPDDDGPLFLKGLTICAAFMLAVAFLALALRFRLVNLNRKLSSSSSPSSSSSSSSSRHGEIPHRRRPGNTVGEEGIDIVVFDVDHHDVDDDKFDESGNLLDPVFPSSSSSSPSPSTFSTTTRPGPYQQRLRQEVFRFIL